VRDYIILAIVFLSAALALLSPYYGILVWSWLAYFNPHRYAWGIARTFPVATVVAVPTLIATVFAPKNHRIFVRETILLLALWFWFACTTYYVTTVPLFAGHALDAKQHLADISKILLMTIVTILLVESRQKLRGLVLVIVASFGLRALIAAVFFLKTGGQYKIWGPDGTFLGDNNDFALGLNMTIPLFFFMARSETARWLRISIRVLMVCVVISVIGTFSRGGLVGLAVVTVMLLLKSRQKILALVLLAVSGWGVVMLTSTEWKDRMTSFAHGDIDESGESRLIAWRAGWKFVQDYPLTGGGFNVYADDIVFAPYIEDAYRYKYGGHGPHSIYIQTLEEQGFTGLFLFFALLASCYMSMRKLRRRAQQVPSLSWAVPYANMFEISLLVFMANGATLGRAYFDLFYQIVACTVVLKIVWIREARALADAPVTIVERELEPAVAV
jgi:probable O-glycosylation ligase (exosortase A-associated)